MQQLKGLYSQTKVIKQQLCGVKQHKNNHNKIKLVQQTQSERNLAHKQIVLNENESRLFTMITEGVIEKQLMNIREKINQNEISRDENKKGINQTNNNVNYKIEKLAEIVNQVKIETKLNSIKLKIVNVNVLYDFLKTSSQYILFQNSIIQLLQILKKECLNKYVKIEERLTLMMEDYKANKLPFQKLNQQFSKLEQEAKQKKKEIDLKLKIELENIKINAISIFFTNKKIKTMNLLYKASDNNFQVSKFWDKCNGKTNTLTILKTQFGKIIGGYTPLAWNFPELKKNRKRNGHQQDKRKQTFLFSITQKHKIPIQENQEKYAIYHATYCGPAFGNYDLQIGDKANISQSSSGDIGRTYNNGEYDTYFLQQYNKYKLNEKWSGQSNGSNFLIQQWEVYQIKFEE